MIVRRALGLMAALLLAACTGSPGSGPESASGAPQARVASASSTPAATLQAPGGGQDTAQLVKVAAGDTGGLKIVEGTDYTVVSGGQPLEPLNGKIEVVEFFNYICPACNSFEPIFEAWKAKQPADVRVTLVPATFRDDFMTYAKVYYAADALGLLEKTHTAAYAAIHSKHTLPGEGEKIDETKIAAFYAGYGVTADQFLNTMKGFSVATKTGRATQFMTRSQISSTPSLIINGRYLIKARSWEDKLRVADALIARERAAAGRGSN